MTKKKRAALAKEFHRAAEKIVDLKKYGCCSAIESEMAQNIFEVLFLEDARSLGHTNRFWFRHPDEAISDPTVQNRRVLGLLLCAELVRTGELPWEVK